jgi:SAM-dependent methyltransferase
MTRSSTHAKSLLGRWIAIPLIVLLSWLIFCMAAAANYYDKDSPKMMSLFIVLGLIPAVISKMMADSRSRWWPSLRRRLEEHTDHLNSLPSRHIGIWVALAAGAGLYFELVLIRYHGTCFAVFGFFKNLSLLSCFLGLGMGYALGRVRLILTPLVLPLLAIQLIVTHLLRFSDIASTMGNPIFEQRAMGLPTVSGVSHIVLVYAFLIWIFAFNALCLMPLGQLASHLMGRGAKLATYSWNLVGSIAAVLLFWALSYLWTPPVLWFAVGFAALLPFLRGTRILTLGAAAVVLGLVGTSFNLGSYDLYSPYQILTVLPTKSGSTMIMVNHFYYQGMFDLSPQGPGLNGNRELEQTYYGLPYLFQKSPQDVLIVGSGSGNDAASALRHGVGHVDAVEIDPLILRLGQMLHPEAPYASDRVTPHVQDARAYFRFTDKKYDLIVYGLLDSHTSLSAMSGVRLDSYIYTVEAFRQARRCLKDNGVLCLSFASATEEFGAKLSLMLKEAFDGRQPRVFVAPMPVGATIFVIGKNAQATPAAVPPGIIDMTDYFATHQFAVDPSTDNWPFFYMPARTYPVSYLVMIAILMVMAVLFILPVAQSEAGRVAISWPCFLLGAGFMLLETKAITELALFYGSTWIVISIVILAILVMAFLANLVVMRWSTIPRAVSYILLLASLGLSLWFSMESGVISSQWQSEILPTAILTLPLFFSGLIFSAEMESANSVAAALGSNLIGAMLGGCLEYNSMYFGYRSLYVLAIVIYALSMIVSITTGGRGRKHVDGMGQIL